MASLYNSAQQARKIILGILVFFALVMIFNIYGNLTRRDDLIPIGNAQRFYLNPNTLFGQIESPEIPGIEYNSNAQFTLDGRHSQTFPDVSFVYAINSPRSRVLDLSNLEAIAKNIGFLNDYIKEGSIVTWNNSDNTKSFKANLESRVWTMETKYLENEAALARKNLLEADERGDRPLELLYERLSGQILTRLKVNSKFGLNNAYVRAELAERGIDQFLVNTTNVEDTEYIHMAFSRLLPLIELKERSEQPDGDPPPTPEPVRVYSDDPRDGQLTLIVSNRVNDYANDLFELDFIDYEYDTSIENRGVYAIITPDEAWSKVQRGEGSLTFFWRQGSNYFAEYSNVEVSTFEAQPSETKLGFYEPNEWNGYATPIYVFEGTATLKDGTRASFIFYVDAIKKAE